MAKRPPKPNKPPKNPDRPWGGRPALLTPELGRTIIETVRTHGFDYLAAQSAGISRDTLMLWRSRARDGEQPYADFIVELDAAKAEFVKRGVKAIYENKDWKAKAFVLERLERQLAMPNKVEVSGPDGGPIPTRSVVSIEKAEEFRAQVLGVAKPESADD